MARKTNYSFEKNTKAKAKADKREAKRLAKLERKEGSIPEGTAEEGSDLEQNPQDTPAQAE